MKTPVLFSAVLLLLVSACVVADDSPRSVAVSGTGTVNATADRASVNMSIVVRDPTVAKAQAGAADVTAKVLEIIDRQKIDRRQVDTTGASVRPDYRYNRESGEQTLNGYIAERNIRVEVHDLEKLASLVEQSVAAGVNQVSPPQLYSSTQRESYREALDLAAADARANAARLAAALGMKLGSVLQIDTGSRPVPYAAQRQMMMADAAPPAEATYNPGELSVTTSINVVFELLVP